VAPANTWTARQSRSWFAVCVVVGTVAFLARLIPVLRSGGLFSISQYDAAVYFGAAVGLVHGELPYRDYLLLHPPGSTLALAPFAGLGYAVGDSAAWATARVAMMALGALTAVLVSRVLWPVGALPALLGGLFYAVYLPAVTIEITTRLEPLAAACLLGALVLLGADSPRTALPPGRVALAGALLGFATTVKIWGLVPLLVVAIYVAVAAGMRQAARFAGGAAVAGVVVCLPFLLAAPAQMWRQVVSNQFGRSGSEGFRWGRFADMSGLGAVYEPLGEYQTAGVIAASVVIAIAAVLASRVIQARLSVVLLAAFAALLTITPTWFPHYAGVWAGVLAVTLGAAASVLLRSAGHRRLRRLVVAGVGAVMLAGAALQLTQVEFGERFPSGRMTAAVATVPGCITADDPGALLQMNVLGRNLRRSCPLVLDLGGYSYDFRPQRTRSRDPRWQRFFLDHMASGTITMKTRYHTGFGLSRASAREFRRWPVFVEHEGFQLRQPRR